MLPEENEQDDLVLAEEGELGAPEVSEQDDAAPEKDDGEIDSSNEDESDGGQQDKKKKGRRRGNDLNKRLKELWAKHQDSQRLLQEERIAKDTESQRSSKAMETAQNAIEKMLDTQRENLELKLEAAKNAGDVEKEVKLSTALTEIMAQKAQLDRYKMERQVEPDAKSPTKQPQVITSYDDLIDSSAPAQARWLSENRDWFDVDSEDYDADRSEDVRYFVRNLERQLIAQGRGAEIGTLGYCKQIDKYITENWSDEVSEVDEKPSKSTQVNRKAGNSLPASNRAPGTQAPVKKQLKFTSAEKELALSMPLRHPNGADYSDEEKIRAYVYNRENGPKTGPISARNLKKGF